MLYLGIMLIYITSQFSQLWMLLSIGLMKSIRLWLKDIFSKIQHNIMVSYLYQNVCFRSMESKGFSVGADQRIIFGDNFRSALDHSNTLIESKLNCTKSKGLRRPKPPHIWNISEPSASIKQGLRQPNFPSSCHVWWLFQYFKFYFFEWSLFIFQGQCTHLTK